MNARKVYAVIFILVSIIAIWLYCRLELIKRDLESAYSAHAETLESVIAAQMALRDGRSEALLLASESLDEARANSAWFFSTNQIFNKNVMFIMEYNNEELIESRYLDDKQKFDIQHYLDKTRALGPDGN